MPYGEQQKCVKIFNLEHFTGNSHCANLGAEIPLPHNEVEIENLKSILSQFGGERHSAFEVNAIKDDAGEWVDYSGNSVNIDQLSPVDTSFPHMMVYGENSDWTFGTNPFASSNAVIIKAICLKDPQLGKPFLLNEQNTIRLTFDRHNI